MISNSSEFNRPDSASSNVNVIEATESHNLGPIEQIPIGQGRCFIARGKRLAVFRLRDGKVFAIDDTCPHRGGPLGEGMVGVDRASQTDAVVCPYHSYKFCLRDGRGLDTESHVLSYPVEVCNGRILVRLTSST